MYKWETTSVVSVVDCGPMTGFREKEELMKRIFALFLCFALALSVACGTKEQSETVESTSAQPSGQAEETVETAAPTLRTVEESEHDTPAIATT